MSPPMAVNPLTDGSKRWKVRSFRCLLTINDHGKWYSFLFMLNSIHCWNWLNLRDVGVENFEKPFRV